MPILKQLNKLVENDSFEELVTEIDRRPNRIDESDPNDDGTTPLITACQFGREKIAKYLLQKGADVNKADDDGEGI